VAATAGTSGEHGHNGPRREQLQVLPLHLGKAQCVIHPNRQCRRCGDLFQAPEGVTVEEDLDV